MQQDDYRTTSRVADEQASSTPYRGTLTTAPASGDELKEPPQSAISILLWGDRRRRRERDAIRRANQTAPQPEWFQAFFVLWVSVFVLIINTGAYSPWLFGFQIIFLLALFQVQSQKRDPSLVPLHPNEMSAWLLEIAYCVLIFPPLFVHGYIWRLPVLASYCLLQLWLIESGGYTRETTQQTLASSSPRQRLLINIAVFAFIIGIFVVVFVGWGTSWPLVFYCVAVLTLIIVTRPKRGQTSSSASTDGWAGQA